MLQSYGLRGQLVMVMPAYAIFLNLCILLPHPGKVLEFFCCPGKSLNFVYKSWKVLENIWEVSRALPGQNSKSTFFNK